MKVRIAIVTMIAGALMLCSCNREKHFITDGEYRAQVHEDFLKRQELAKGRAAQLFGVMDTICVAEKEALEFLYAYMPFSDLADYDGEFYLNQVRTAFNARETFSWGANVPEDIFRHFVLVYRVNNEDLDTARMFMFNQLKDRIKDLTMYEAALEVNHWCHEHVAYRAADARTSAPLATLRTSLGRCGEESTFTVTAMRSVGIPARQCYTPRWAHCDDNHAWVEVWIDGKWYFLGACEPSPELDMGWFAVPSTRTMMVHSNVFGRYHGDEEVNFQNDLYAKVNMLSNYAPTCKATVKVVDTNGNPVKGAKVKYKLYNYSEYYSLATIETNEDGVAQLTTGKGDLLVWATNGESYNYAKMDTRKIESIELCLSRQKGEEYEEQFDIVPPVAGDAKIIPTPERQDANAIRVAAEDSMLCAYIASFPTVETVKSLVEQNENLTDEQVWQIIHKSEGNYQEISKFLNCHKVAEDGLCLYDYLMSYSDKDLRDTPAEILEAQLTYYADTTISYEVYKKGILPARISNELVRPWRQFLKENLALKTVADVKTEAMSINIDKYGNYYNCPISPRGVFELRNSDAHSRDIYFVALCRSMEIPAYLDNATNTIYAYENGVWQNVSLDENVAPVAYDSKLVLTYNGTNPQTPVYWINFTIAKFENGDFVSFDFEEDPRMATFPATISIEPGYYLLSTGNRYTDGEVLSQLEYFVVEQGQEVTKEIHIRPLVEGTDVFGRLDSSMKIGETLLSELIKDNGLLYCNLGGFGEPSKHLAKEMQELASDVNAFTGSVYVEAPASAKKEFESTPNIRFVANENGDDAALKSVIRAMGITFTDQYPLMVYINKNGDIIFHSEGYHIGSVEQFLKLVK